MWNMTVYRAAQLCGGRLCGENIEDKPLENIVIDSRFVSTGDMFVAYKGENVDGHMFISAALDRGASCCLAERLPAGEERCVILVNDVQRALEKICEACRSEINVPFIGITGSVGKTTAKEMIAAVLSQRLNVLKTDKNLNNQIGVPMTLSRVRPQHEAAVVEMGISNFGDMAELAAMVRPDIMVFTVIGHAHLEFLHDLDGVFKEKTSVLDYMPDDGLAIINGDDVQLQKLSCRQNILSYGLGDRCDVRAEGIVLMEDGYTDCDIVYGHRRLHAHINAYGQHMVYAALEGAAVGFAMGFDDGEIERGIAAYRTVGRRAAVCRTGYLTLVDDSYNANPDSMRCSIESLMRMPGRHVCILGDMLEMGERSAQMHEDIGRYAAELGADAVFSCGGFAEQICSGFGKGGSCFQSREELMEALPGALKRGDNVLVKASRGAHFEEIAEKVKMLERKPIVFMDIDDTILDFHKAEAIAVSETLRRMGIEPEKHVVARYSEINQGQWEKLERGEISRGEVMTSRFDMLFAELGVDRRGSEAQEIYETLLPIGHHFMPNAPEVLDGLYGLYELYITSNGAAATQDSRLESAGIKKYFERIFISEKVGAEKPSREFFDRCFAEIPEFDKERAMIVGDSLTSDILGGINAGIKTCWFNPKNKGPREDIVPDYEIHELMELLPLLEKIFA